MTLWQSKTMVKGNRGELDDEAKERLNRTTELANKICIMMPHRSGEGIHPENLPHTVQWINAGIMVRPEKDAFGGFIDIFRARLCKMFLRETERKYLVMLDNDVVPFDALAPFELCDHDLPVVSGVACALRPGVGTFACIGVKDSTGVARFPTTLDTGAIPAYGIKELQSCGAGFLAIRRDVIEAMVEEPFLLPQDLRLEAVETGMLRKTEDIYFGQQVREAGFKLYADLAVHCFHDKSIPLFWPRDLIDKDLSPDDWDVTTKALAVEKK